MIVVFALLFIASGLWGVINPRSQWQTMKGWQYRNREANEPSDAAYTYNRVMSAVGLVVGVMLLVTGGNFTS